MRVFALGVYRKLARRSVFVLVALRLRPYTPFFARKATLVGDADQRISDITDFALLVLLRGSVPPVLRRSLRANECLPRPSVRRAQPRTDAAARDMPVDCAAMLRRMRVRALSVNDMVLNSQGSVAVAGQRDVMLVALVLMLLAVSIQGRNARPSSAMHWRMPSASFAPVALRVCVVTIRWKCCVVA